ncbi:predicted protein [Naegleria gruberi]|uniref:Predicted protein n=1 Tax=Naegleria gruberi TaxID=5762 RepID=D2V189_NAEGR|nr:uncharacterized protein NAEGRDRAFT_78213 [Naegleria gruberi]EFC49266.1 predicted protein [Naegleria gruberi]|eukprot:XP_002682010.1 predicted protein [Naegleria gruberi strain NEG-M]
MPVSSSEEEKQNIIAKWEEVFKVGSSMTSKEAIQENNLGKEGNFEYCHTKQNVDVYALKTEHSTIVRGDIVVEGAKAEEFLAHFGSVDLAEKVKFDSTTKRIEIVEQWTDESDGSAWRVQYFVISVGALVSDRDFLYVLRIFKKDNITYFLTTSIDGLYTPPSTFQPQNKAVRGTNLFVCQRYETLENGDLHISYANQVSPNGWIPISIVNANIYPVPLSLAKIADSLKKKTKVPSNSPSLKK